MRGNGKRTGRTVNCSSHEAGLLSLVDDDRANSCMKVQHLGTVPGLAERRDGIQPTKGMTGTRCGRWRRGCFLLRNVMVTLLKRDRYND